MKSEQATETAPSQEENLNKLRHSTAHVMAQAVQELFPGTKLTIGPPIEDGFYYDFDSPHTFVPEDLKKIEERMRAIAKENLDFVMSTHSSDEARKFWGDRGEKYKVELINDLNAPTVTYCAHGSFVDLCRGGHVENTREIRHFKLLKIAGSYWRGDEKRERLQRIYGTAWPSREALDEYVKRQEEAKKRDHRELGPRLGLFTILPETIGPGLIFWLPKGATLRRLIEEYLRVLLEKNNYQFVVTPHVARVELWKTSGHWDFYQENMFSPMKIDEQDYLLKPMNCPGHIQIYKHALHSYRDLPIRITEMGTVYRYERSGVMHGLLRVRGFTQDDAHIFCRPDQIGQEVEHIIDLTLQVLKTFGFHEYQVSLSTRPEKFVGAIENWDRAEKALAESLERKGLKHDIDAGGGAFYGPKIDLKIKDSLGRYWQCSTVQVDFNLPERFDVSYRGESGKEERAIMVHRALLGSIERFVGILIEQFAGAFPPWLAPVQAKILTITDRQNAFAEKIAEDLKAHGFRVEADVRNEKIGAKIREGTLEKVPYLLVTGDREMAEGKVAVRKRSGEDMGVMTVQEFIDKLTHEVESRT
jgi:threonyl-tRNA synthetase